MEAPADPLRRRTASPGAYRTATGRTRPFQPCRNGSGNAPTTTGARSSPSQDRKSHHATSPARRRYSTALRSPSIPFTNQNQSRCSARSPSTPCDRLDEAAAVAGLDVRLRAERTEQRLPRVDLRVEEHLLAAVARDPEGGLAGRAVLPAAAARDGEQRGGEERDEPGAHFTAFDRTAPASVARTSPECRPTQPRPRAFVRMLRPSTRNVARAAEERRPASLTDETR